MIARLNDAFRRGLGIGRGLPAGRVVMTRGVAALGEATVPRVLLAVARFDTFTPANDPYGEHDCAILEVEGERILWKIDYYADEALEAGAEDPAAGCYRVLTIMLAQEY